MNSKNTNVAHECKKGQYFSFDAITATVIFIVGISLLFSYWINVQNDTAGQAMRLQKRTLAVSDSLLSTGYPAGWSDPSAANQLGLAQGGANLSSSKIIALASYARGNYSILCNRLGLPNVHILIVRVEDKQTTEIGKPPSTDATQIAQVWRVASLEGKIVQLEVTSWAAPQ